MDEEPKIQVSPNRRNLLIVTILAVVLTFPTIPALLYKYAIDAPSRNTQVVEFDIEQGMSVSDISVALYEEGVIESPIIFKVFIRVNNLQSKIQAGVYNIEPKTSIVELASLFGLGTNDTKLTFIEGWRREEFAQYAAASLKNVSYAEFVAKTQNLEGKLFPDTYFLSEDVTTQELIDKLASTFEEKTVDLLTDSKLAVLGMTEDEVITLASIIEREVHSEDARKLVAGILLKRLREGMPLQADATTQYAVALDKHCIPETCRRDGVACKLAATVGECLEGTNSELLVDITWWPKEITQYDLDLASPYNTRNTQGLPPGPISSVSVSAIEAVLNSKESDYYFYITGNDGEMYYAGTLDEHNANVAQHL